MKALSFKLPLSISTAMEDNKELSGLWITGFLNRFVHHTFEPTPINEFTVNHTYKIPDTLHKTIKLKALEADMPINEYVCQLYHHFYERRVLNG